MKIFTLMILLFVTSITSAEVRLRLPEGWVVKGAVIYDGNKKVGELASKNVWNYSNGEDFINAFKNGFDDDPETTEYLDSGVTLGIFWVCRKVVFEGANGEIGDWFARRFWVSGPILTLYSEKSCNHEFEKAISIALTLSE